MFILIGITVTCSNCSYTEFYKGKSSALGNAFDLFT
ncbi:zinc ribbon domain-containing protein [Shewanella sp. 10N.261.52.F9]